MAVPMFPTIADHNGLVKHLSNHSNQSEPVEALSEWPQIDQVIGETDRDTEPPYGWMSRPIPSELRDFPENVPAELLRILKLSTKPDQYRNQDDEKEIVPPDPPQIPPSIIPPRTSSRETQSSDVASEITRCSSSMSQWSLSNSKDGVSIKSALGKLSVKAPKEVRAISFSMKTKFVLQECASCLEGIIEKNLLRLQCQHRYCLKCFITLITTALNNENQFPPKCCLVEVPAKLILHNLDNAKRDLYKQKIQEYSIPQQNRWYCPSHSCGKWIAPKKIKDSAAIQKCPFCKVKICGYCRGSQHTNNLDCPRDAGLEATLEEAEMHGWRRCHQCRAMVELVSGCRHMTCKCGAQFCYTCGAQWRTCGCTEEDQRLREDQLREQRLVRNETTEREARELAEALEEIERLEQREVEERLRQELREAEERARQEEQRRRLEEEQRQKEEERAREKEVQRILMLAESMRNLRLALTRINKSQQTIMNMRHEADARALQSKIEDEMKQFEERRQQLESALQSNVRQRTDALLAAQEAEVKKLASKHEDEEDETFISMSRHLKNKPNREERERSIMEKLKASQERELVALRKAHNEAMEELDFKASLESRSLEAGLAREIQNSCPSIGKRNDLAREIIVDRHWFHVVTKKRSDLLELHRLRLAKGEPSLSAQEVRPKRPYFSKFSGPPSPPPTCPLPAPPTMLPPLTPTPSSPARSDTPTIVQPPEKEALPPPEPVALPVVTEKPAPKPVSLKEMIKANARNRRVNRSAFGALYG